MRLQKARWHTIWAVRVRTRPKLPRRQTVGWLRTECGYACRTRDGRRDTSPFKMNYQMILNPKFYRLFTFNGILDP